MPETSIGTAPRDWNETVRRLGGTIFHTTLWAEYQRAAHGIQPVYIRGETSAGTYASLGLLWQSRYPIAAQLFRELEFYAHPCGMNGDATGTAEFVTACEGVARELGCRQVRLSSVMSGSSPFVPAEHGYTETQRIEFFLDLTRPAAELWRGIRKDQRERVRRMQRDGVRIDIGSTRADLEGLRSVRETTLDRRRARAQELDLPADQTFYDRLFLHLIQSGGARLYLARRGEETLAGLFFVTFNGRACSLFSGSTAAGYHLGAQSALFWSAVETLQSDGFHELNRGAVPASAADPNDPLHGIYLFKLRLGTTPLLCRSGEKTLSPMRQRIYRLRETLRAWHQVE